MSVISQQSFSNLKVESLSGHEREEGELSGEEPQRQPSDELQLSLSYHSGGAPAASALYVQSAYAFWLRLCQYRASISCGAARVPKQAEAELEVESVTLECIKWHLSWCVVNVHRSHCAGSETLSREVRAQFRPLALVKYACRRGGL